MIFEINNELWRVCFVEPHSPVLMGTLGVTILEEKTIYLADDLYGELLHRVLCHELTHAEFAARGLILPVYVEECLADITADNIVDVRSVANSIHNNLCKYYNKC